MIPAQFRHIFKQEESKNGEFWILRILSYSICGGVLSDKEDCRLHDKDGDNGNRCSNTCGGVFPVLLAFGLVNIAQEQKNRYCSRLQIKTATARQYLFFC